MLDSKYQDVIIGKNYMSVTYALMRMIKGKSIKTLLVDDKNVHMGTGWCNKIGRIEKQILESFGKKFGISALKQIDLYVRPIKTIIFLNEKMIEFGSSPFANIRELARKLPDIFFNTNLHDFEKLNPEEFDEKCFAIFNKLANLQISQLNTSDPFKIEENNLEKILNDFILHLKKDEAINKQFHFVLQVLHQTFFTNAINDIESKYLLISIISPRFTIDEKRLLDDLIFEFQSKKGEVTTSTISQWQSYKGGANYLLLESVDGVLQFDRLYYFGKIINSMPFTRLGNEIQFHSIEMECPLEHDFINFFKNKRILFSQHDRLGSDFPHWELEINDSGILKAIYSYANYEGTKPSFYYKKVTEDIFRSLQQILPGIKMTDWSEQIIYRAGTDFWVESLNSKRSTVKEVASRDDRLFDKETKQEIQNIVYCGPNRTRTMGLFSYALDLLSST